MATSARVVQEHISSWTTFTLKIEANGAFDTSEATHPRTQIHIPEDSSLRQRNRYYKSKENFVPVLNKVQSHEGTLTIWGGGR